MILIRRKEGNLNAAIILNDNDAIKFHVSGINEGSIFVIFSPLHALPERNGYELLFGMVITIVSHFRAGEKRFSFSNRLR